MLWISFKFTFTKHVQSVVNCGNSATFFLVTLHYCIKHFFLYIFRFLNNSCVKIIWKVVKKSANCATVFKHMSFEGNFFLIRWCIKIEIMWYSEGNVWAMKAIAQVVAIIIMISAYHATFWNTFLILSSLQISNNYSSVGHWKK